MFTFANLAFEQRRDGRFDMGIQAIHRFPNGYSISVIKGPHTYGGREGFYELAVMDDDGLRYDTPVTDDVLGWLTPEDVTRHGQAVEALPEIASCPPSESVV